MFEPTIEVAVHDQISPTEQAPARQPPGTVRRRDETARPDQRRGTARGATPDDALGRVLARSVHERAAIASPSAGARVLQRVVSEVGEEGKTLHVGWGSGFLNTEPVPGRTDPPVLIEVMEGSKASAKAKIAKVAQVNGAALSQKRLAIAIALNKKVTDPANIDAQKYLKAKKGKALMDGYGTLVADAREVADEMARLGVIGACFPAIWAPTDQKEGGYVFPFLEMRARTTLHPSTQAVVTLLSNGGREMVVVRSMDADVRNDPLLAGNVGATELAPLGESWEAKVVSGGYDWDASAPADPPHPTRLGETVHFWGNQWRNKATLDQKWTNIITLINQAEHARRVRLAGVNASLVYWPEPNTYMSSETRLSGAESIISDQDHQVKQSQQRESVFYLKEPASKGALTGTHDPAITTTKPVKTYFDWLKAMLVAAKAPKLAEVKKAIEDIRQSHLSPNHVGDIQKETWYGVRAPLDNTMKGTLEQERVVAVNALAQSVLSEITR